MSAYKSKRWRGSRIYWHQKRERIIRHESQKDREVGHAEVKTRYWSRRTKGASLFRWSGYCFIEKFGRIFQTVWQQTKIFVESLIKRSKEVLFGSVEEFIFLLNKRICTFMSSQHFMMSQNTMLEVPSQLFWLINIEDNLCNASCQKQQIR